MSTATVPYTEPVCPKCSGPLWDNRVGKKNPKAPDFKCKDKNCDGVIWPPRTAAKAAPAKLASPSYNSRASKPEAELPEFLRDAEAQDSAELHAMVGGQPNAVDGKTAAKEAYATAQRQALRVALDILVPLYEEKEIGLTDDVVHKHSFELFKMWCDKGLVA